MNVEDLGECVPPTQAQEVVEYSTWMPKHWALYRGSSWRAYNHLSSIAGQEVPMSSSLDRSHARETQHNPST